MIDSDVAVCEREAMKARPRVPAVWVLHQRRPSTVTAEVEAERRRLYAAMAPGERLRRALRLSSFARRLRLAPRHP